MQYLLQIKHTQLLHYRADKQRESPLKTNCPNGFAALKIALESKNPISLVILLGGHPWPPALAAGLGTSPLAGLYA